MEVSKVVARANDASQTMTHHDLKAMVTWRWPPFFRKPEFVAHDSPVILFIVDVFKESLDYLLIIYWLSSDSHQSIHVCLRLDWAYFYIW